MERTVRLSGLSCESCAALISRTAAKNGVNVVSSDLESGNFTFESESPASVDFLLSKLEELGYSSRGLRGSKIKRVKSMMQELISGSLVQEREMLVYSVLSVIVSIGLQFILFPLIGYRAQFTALLPFIAMLDVSAGALLFSMWHFFSLKSQVSCMTGMMVGMTMGMIGGFLSGYVIGATNGMFMGSVFGVAIGFVLGVWAGSCCGVMGAMEGIMAGLMSGTMGAMLSIMMLSDHLMLFSAFFLAVCLAILGASFYMLNKEFGNVNQAEGHAQAVMFAAALSTVLAFVIMAGPKGPIVFVP